MGQYRESWDGGIKWSDREAINSKVYAEAMQHQNPQDRPQDPGPVLPSQNPSRTVTEPPITPKPQPPPKK